MSSLAGKHALVTGGGSGIGLGIAEVLAAAGADVVIVGRRPDVLEEAEARLRGAGLPVRGVVCDVTKDDQVERVVGDAAGDGNLDILIANAGTGFPGAILDLPPEGWEFALGLNVVGTASCIKYAARVMKDHGGGSIVVISSTSALKVQPWMAPYNVSKAAADMLVRCAAVELSPHRIRVNGIQPGFVPTEMFMSFSSDALNETLTRATPIGRVGTPGDVGHAVAFLVTDHADWITGQVFGVDGGLNIPVMPNMAVLALKVYGEDYVAGFPLPDLTSLPPSRTSS